MKLLAWNIQHGGRARLDRIVEVISGYDADVVALTEFRTKPGVNLCSGLKDEGLVHIATTNPPGNQNGIAVFSRTPMQRTRPCPAPSENLTRWLDIDLLGFGFDIGVLHVMGARSSHPTGEAKTRFWDAVLQAAESRLHEPFLFIGDWNTGAHGLDEKGKTFVCAEHFARLSTSGWTDLWRLHHPGITEYTWYSRLKGGAQGNGFRLDHAFATPSLIPRVTSCWYSHTEREARVSDHSVMIVETT